MIKRGFLLFWSVLKDFFLIILGVLSAAFALEGFLIPNGFIDGGVTGVSLLIAFLTPASISLSIFVINIPFIILARYQFGKKFAIKTFIAILLLSLALIFVEYPIITTDKLLVAVFGGFFLGAGVGLSVRGGGVLDGTEVLSVYLNKKVNLTMGEIIFFINVVIFSFAAFLLSVEAALYSLLTYLSASKTVDFFVHGIEEYTGITVISEKNKEIRKKLTKDLAKGVTVYKGKGGYNHTKEKEILFVVITRLEVSKIKHEILLIDPHAVIIEQSIKEARGGIIKKHPLPE